MTGNETTKNNRGFIQMRTLTNSLINAKKYDGVYIKVYRNNKNYSLHIRTKLTWHPGNIILIVL